MELSNYIPLLVMWVAFAVAVLILALYRRSVAQYEDDTLHVSHDDTAITQQQTLMAERLGRIDRWGKSLTVVTVFYGLFLAAGYLYLAWQESANYIPR
jgi:hypothetical protein